MTRPVLHWPCAKLCPWSSLQIRLVSWEFCKKQRFKTQHFQLGILMFDSCRHSNNVSLSDLESVVSKPKNASSTASQGAGGGYLLHLPRGANHLLSQQRLDTPLLPGETAGLRCDMCTMYLEKRIWKDGKENNGKKYSSYTATPFDVSIFLPAASEPQIMAEETAKDFVLCSCLTTTAACAGEWANAEKMPLCDSNEIWVWR